ncbi:MAG TPA: MBL fold metallo-hydrolase [Candidatus Brocadiales bacterium]|nr:MBL fold metallo-hydrolase [Candidatus Brocadiales bacterium]
MVKKQTDETNPSAGSGQTLHRSGAGQSFIKFLGTAGARFVVSTQLRASGGIWFSLDGVNILGDPGPGCLVRCTTSRPKMNPAGLDAIILTHRHLDHCGDVNIMIEAMTEGGTKKRGALFAPQQALEDDPVVFQYVRKFLPRLEVLKEGGTYQLDGISFSTPVRHQHPAETYGVNFKTSLGTISWMVDTAFFPELLKHYRGDVLILHSVRYKDENDKEKGIYHLNMEDIKNIVNELRPRVTLLTHFGMTMLRARPHELAGRLSEETGCRVIAASDGMRFELAGV